MKIATKLLMLCLAALIASGCVFEGDDSKSDIRRQSKGDSDTDYCAIYDWYGDGVCDDFCLNPDPDCATTCAAVPTCDVYETEVDSCENTNGECREVTECGVTIACEGEMFCAGIAACQEGYEAVESCDGSDDCYVETYCGNTVSCRRSEVNCLAFPVCPDGTIENSECPEGRSDCLAVSECGSTIMCQYVDQCAAVPTCPDGTVEVEDCGLDPTFCEEVSMCGMTIMCRQDVMCDALPVCQAGYVELADGCPANSQNCYRESACGTTIGCAAEGPDCTADPVCPANHYETDDCPQDSSCFVITDCGKTITCTDA